MNNFQISLNTLDRTLTYKGVEKIIKDSFWIDEIVSILYPLWSTDKDKLEYFIKKEDGSYIIFKNKYTRNHKNGTYQWIPYEEDIVEYTKEELDGLYESLKTKFLEYKNIENKSIDEFLKREYARDNVLNWNKIRMIRNFLLSDSDWTQVVDASVSREEKKQWKLYRTTLRDITTTYSNMNTSIIKWPITPTKYKSLEDKTNKYLEDEFGHFYNLNTSQINDLSKRIVDYLALSVSIGKINENDVELLERPPQNRYEGEEEYVVEYSLDDIIDYVTGNKPPVKKKAESKKPQIVDVEEERIPVAAMEEKREPNLDNLIDLVSKT